LYFVTVYFEIEIFVKRIISVARLAILKTMSEISYSKLFVILFIKWNDHTIKE